MKLKKETPPPVRQLFLVEKRKSFQYATLWEKKRKSFVTKLDVKHCVFNWKTCRSSGNSSASARTMSCTTLFTWTRRGSFLEQPLFFPLSIFYIYIYGCVCFFFGVQLLNGCAHASALVTAECSVVDRENISDCISSVVPNSITSIQLIAVDVIHLNNRKWSPRVASTRK